MNSTILIVPLILPIPVTAAETILKDAINPSILNIRLLDFSSVCSI